MVGQYLLCKTADENHRYIRLFGCQALLQATAYE
jgi:hypothetical protein